MKMRLRSRSKFKKEWRNLKSSKKMKKFSETKWRLNVRPRRKRRKELCSNEQQSN
jgi:hypothetical protein